MTNNNDGWLTRAAVTRLRHAAHRRAEADPEWSAAVLAELPSIPPGRTRLLWAIGGLWFLLVHRTALVRRTATWPVRLVALAGMAWIGMWLSVFAAGLADDAPDTYPPHATWIVITHTVVLAVFALALWRPILAAIAAIPAIGWFTAVIAHPVDLDGNPIGDVTTVVAAIAAFATVPLLLVAVIAILAAMPLKASRHR